MNEILEKKDLVSIIAPVYNEEQVIQEFIQRINKTIQGVSPSYDFELILVNDCSTDQSLSKMRALLKEVEILRIVDLRRNYGQTYALQCGIDMANGDILISLDSDLQHFPEEIPLFLKKISEGYDVVCGWRSERAEGIIRRWPSRVANKMIQGISKIDIHDFGTTYRAYRSELVKELTLLGEFHRFIPVLLGNMGCTITEIPIKNIERPEGKSNYGLGRTIGVCLDLVLLYFLTRYLDRPLRAFGKIAMLIFMTGFSILAVLIIYAYVYNVHATQTRIGWFLLSIFLLISSLQIFLTGILCEVLTRIHFSVKDRDVYKIKNEWNVNNIS